MQANQFMKRLYQAVDEKSLEKLSLFLADQVNFKLANFPREPAIKSPLLSLIRKSITQGVTLT